MTVDLGEGPDARLPELLESWGRAANALQEEELAATVRLQADLLRGWRNWDQALAAFRRVPAPRFADMQDRLFTQWKHLVADGWRDDRALTSSRRRWLERLGAFSVVPEMLSFWKRNLRWWVPDPALAGPRYDHCADWAKALWEMEAAAGRELLSQWVTTHHRRRNLWSALRARNVPVPGTQK